MQYGKFLYVLSLLLIVLSAADASAQNGTCSTDSLEEWLNCEVAKVAGTRLNQQANNNQVELPSIADNTTTLVDQTSAPALFGMGLNLSGLSGKSKDGTDKTSFSFTTSAYALYAAFLQKDPQDPDFYAAHPKLRRWFFTFGQESPENGVATEKNKTTLLGVKYLIINRRDVSEGTNRVRLGDLRAKGAAHVAGSTLSNLATQLAPEVKTYISSQLALNAGFVPGPNFAADYGALRPDQKRAVKALISDGIESMEVTDTQILRAIEQTEKGPQLAFTFQSKLRQADGTDEYRSGLAFDYGLQDRLNLTLNGTFDYLDSKIVGGDKRSGRVAGEATFELNRDPTPFGGTGPYTLFVSGESKWTSNDKPTHTGQLKLIIPIFNGVSFPISVSFANRTELIKEATVRGRFGFTFDLTKLLNGVR